MTDPVHPSPRAARTFAWLAAGAAAFVLYGSLVPFEFRTRPKGDAGESFRWAMANRAAPQSRADGLANVLLGVPLGFTLLAAVRAGRPRNPAKTLAAAALLVPPCVAFSAAIEFAQLYLPARTCAGSDVYAQAVGVAVGMAGWAAVGRRATEALGTLPPGSADVRRLAAYLALLGFVMTLPTDLTLSPAEIYRKLRDRAVFVPLGEFRGAVPVDFWTEVRKLLELAGVYAPAGFLAAGVVRTFPRAAGLAAVVALGVEAVQVLVVSRTPSATDALAGAAAVLGGWAVAARRRPTAPGLTPWAIGCRPFGTPAESPEGATANSPGCQPWASSDPRARWAPLALWLAGLAVIAWQPFAFGPAAGAVEWLPGAAYQTMHPLFALEGALTKVMLFAPVGFLAAGGRPWVAAGVGAAVAAGLEVGQLWLPGHAAGVTDVILGAAGAAVGARFYRG